MLNYTRIYDDSNGIDQILDSCNEQLEYYIRCIDIDDMIKYSLDETVKNIKNNHGVDDIDMDKAETVMNIYNRIYNILAYFNK
jgi:hypothetical protein